MNPAAMQGFNGLGAVPNAQRPAQNLTPQNITIFLNQQYSRLHAPMHGTWQTEVQVMERVGHAQELITAFRLASPGMQFPAITQRSVKLEMDKFNSSIDKASYNTAIHQCLEQLKQMRQSIAQQMMAAPNQMMAQQRAMQNMQGQATPQLGLQGQSTPSIGLQTPQTFNSQLAQPMQPTPIPNAAQPNMGAIGAQNNVMAAPMMQAQRSQQPQVNQTAQPSGAMPRPNFTDQEQNIIQATALKMRGAAPPAVIERMRLEWDSLPQDKKVSMRGNFGNFLLLRFRQQAITLYMQTRQTNAGLAQLDNSPAQMNQANNQLQQRPQVAAMQSTVPDVASILEQQQNGLRSQAGGNDVVPASNNNVNANNNQQQLANLMALQGQAGMRNALQMGAGLGLRPGMTPMQLQQMQQQQQRIALAQGQFSAQANSTLGPPGQQAGTQNMNLLTQPLQQAGQVQPGMNSFVQGGQQNLSMNNAGFQTLRQAQMAQEQNRTNIREIPEDIRSHIPPNIVEQLNNMDDRQFQSVLVSMRQRIQASQQKAMVQAAVSANGGASAAQLAQVNNQNNQVQNRSSLQALREMQTGQGPTALGQLQQGGNNAMSLMNAASLQAQRLGQAQGVQQPPFNAQQPRGNIGIDLNVMAELDAQPLTETILKILKPTMPIPDGVRTWGQLKAWARIKPGALAYNDQQLLQMQLMQYKKVAFPQQNAARTGMPQGQNVAVSQVTQQQGTLAPTAAMLPTNPGIPQQSNGMPMPVVSDEEVFRFRQLLAKSGANVTEAETRARLIAHKLQQMQNPVGPGLQSQMGQLAQPLPGNLQQELNPQIHAAQAARQAMQARTPQLAAQGLAVGNPQRPDQQQQPVRLPNQVNTQASISQPQPNQQQLQQQLSQLQAQQQIQQSQQAQLQQFSQLQSLQQQQQQPQQRQQQSQPQPQQGAPDAKSRADAAMAARSQQPHQAQLPQDLLKSLTEAQRRALAAGQIPTDLPTNIEQQLRAHIMAQRQGTSEANMRQRLISIVRLAEQSAPKQATVEVSPEERKNLMILMASHWPVVVRGIEQTIFHFMRKNDNERIKSIVLSRLFVQRQLKEQVAPGVIEFVDDMTCSAKQVYDYVTYLYKNIGATQAELARQGKAVADGQSSQPQAAAQVREQAKPASQTQSAVAPTAPAKAARSRDKSKPPPAPTEAKAPFAFTGNSPQGTPVYAQSSGTNFDLKMPPTKKQKSKATPSATSTPKIASGTIGPPNTPAKGKPQASLRTEPPPPKPEQQKPKFACEELGCPHSVQPFDTEAKLVAHTKDAHTMPADPAAFALESVRRSLGLNEKGEEQVQTVKAEPELEKSKAGSSQPNSAVQDLLRSTKSTFTWSDSMDISDFDAWDQFDQNITQSVEQSDWYAGTGIDISRTSSSSGSTDSKLNGDSSRAGGSSDGSPKLTPASSMGAGGEEKPAKQSPDLNGNGKRSREVSESQALEMKLTISDDDAELEALMDMWAEGGTSASDVLLGVEPSSESKQAGAEVLLENDVFMEFGGMKVMRDVAKDGIEFDEDWGMATSLDVLGWEDVDAF